MTVEFFRWLSRARLVCTVQLVYGRTRHAAVYRHFTFTHVDNESVHEFFV